MQVHLFAEAAAPFTRVHEHPGELVPEIDVVRAPAPFPVLDARLGVLYVRAAALVRRVARARLDHALGARPGHGVRHARAGDRVDESRLSETCVRRTPAATRLRLIKIITAIRIGSSETTRACNIIGGHDK